MLSEKAATICENNIHSRCHRGCPLQDACAFKYGDTQESFEDRMNEAAEKIGGRDEA